LGELAILRGPSCISNKPICGRISAWRGWAQTRLFASIDLAVGLLTLVTQVWRPGSCSAIRYRCIGRALPAVYIIGFTVLALGAESGGRVCIPSSAALDELAIANPARQVFFTVWGGREI